jgi:hypothetical protein
MSIDGREGGIFTEAERAEIYGRADAQYRQILSGKGPAAIASAHGMSADPDATGLLWRNWHDQPESPDAAGYPEEVPTARERVRGTLLDEGPTPLSTIPETVRTEPVPELVAVAAGDLVIALPDYASVNG